MAVVTSRRGTRGFTYIALLVMVTLIGVGLAGAGQVWSTVAKRDREAELLFIGEEFQRAIGSYYDSSAGANKQYPATLADLLEDKRSITVRRHLRRIYRDPFTGRPEWGFVRGPGERILGVYSVAPGAPLKIGNFAKRFESFEGAASCADWKFVYRAQLVPGLAPGGATLPPGLPGSGAPSAPRRDWGSRRPGSWRERAFAEYCTGRRLPRGIAWPCRRQDQQPLLLLILLLHDRSQVVVPVVGLDPTLLEELVYAGFRSDSSPDTLHTGTGGLPLVPGTIQDRQNLNFSYVANPLVDPPTGVFDPDALGTYAFSLDLFKGLNSTVPVKTVSIDVEVPEPATIPQLAMALAVIGVVTGRAQTGR